MIPADAVSRKRTGHFEDPALFILQGSPQIQKTAAFRHRRHAALHRLPHSPAHGPVAGQFPGE